MSKLTTRQAVTLITPSGAEDDYNVIVDWEYNTNPKGKDVPPYRGEDDGWEAQDVFLSEGEPVRGEKEEGLNFATTVILTLQKGRDEALTALTSRNERVMELEGEIVRLNNFVSCLEGRIRELEREKAMMIEAHESTSAWTKEETK